MILKHRAIMVTTVVTTYNDCALINNNAAN